MAAKSGEYGSPSRMKSVMAVRPKWACWPPLMLIQPELSRTTVQTGVPASAAACELLHRLQEVAVAAHRQHLRVGPRQLCADGGRQRESHGREAARGDVGARLPRHPALLDHALRQAGAGHHDRVLARRRLHLAHGAGHRHRRRVGARLDLDLLLPGAARGARSRRRSRSPALPDPRARRAGRPARRARRRAAGRPPGSSCRSRAGRSRAGSAASAGWRR